MCVGDQTADRFGRRDRFGSLTRPCSSGYEMEQNCTSQWISRDEGMACAAFAEGWPAG